jgi:hypothetical protein
LSYAGVTERSQHARQILGFQSMGDVAPIANLGFAIQWRPGHIQRLPA